MSDFVEIAELHAVARPLVLASWRESHKQSPTASRMPWQMYKRTYGDVFSRLIDDKSTLMLGAYLDNDELAGFLVATPGKSVDTLHWVSTRFKSAAGALLRRRGVMSKLIAAANFGPRFVYTLRARREPGHRTLDVLLAKVLAERGQAAGYVALTEWMR